MLADTYRDISKKPFELEDLNCTKSVRNFLCDFLFDDDLLLSYAPTSEFGSATAYRWIMGGWICEYDKKNNGIIPKNKLNWRVIKTLFDAGYLVVNHDIKAPNIKCVLFVWSEEVKASRREIMNKVIFNDNFTITGALLDAICSLYGIKLQTIKVRGLFELLTLSDERIPNGQVARTCILANKNGDPVSRYRDMEYVEWEECIYQAAKRAKTLKTPAPIPDGYISHLSKSKR